MFEIIGFIFIQIFLLALGGALGAICVFFVFLATRNFAYVRGKRVAMVIALLFPLIAVFYLEAGVVGRDLVRDSAGKDTILGGLYHYPLGNGYNLAFFNETAPEGGWIVDPRGGSLPVDRIYGLQTAGDFVYMDADRQPQQGTVPTLTVAHGEVHPPDNPERVRFYLELNTKSHERADYSSVEDLKKAATNRKLQLKLSPLDEFYSEAISAAWPSWPFWGILGTPLLIASFVLLRSLRDIRSRPSSISSKK